MQSSRRLDRERDSAWALAQLKQAEYAFLALSDAGQPYCIPVSPVLIDNAVYFHSADAGYKVDVMGANPKACISCVNYAKRDEDNLTMWYTSVVATGTIELVEEKEEKRLALDEICNKFAPNNAKGHMCAENAGPRVYVYKMVVAGISGKENPR